MPAFLHAVFRPELFEQHDDVAFIITRAGILAIFISLMNDTFDIKSIHTGIINSQRIHQNKETLSVMQWLCDQRYRHRSVIMAAACCVFIFFTRYF